MATAEGIFPKVGGDPPFSSEYNRFSNAIWAGSSGYITPSDVGSIVIPANKLTNPCNLTGIFRLDSNQKTELQIQVSGLSSNATIKAWDAAGGEQEYMTRMSFIIGSPMLGGAFLHSSEFGGVNTITDIIKVDNIDPTQDLIINLSTVGTGSASVSWVISSNNGEGTD